jgi:hypothetical protein
MPRVPPIRLKVRSTLVRVRDQALLVMCILLVANIAGCAKRELRGKSVHSSDGKTYLVIDDDNRGVCGPIEIDDQEWPHPIHEAGEVKAGLHYISCGHATKIEFKIEPGSTFHFDYWGP